MRVAVDENGLPAGNEKVTFGQLSGGPANDKAVATGLQGCARRRDDFEQSAGARADGAEWGDDVLGKFE